MGGSESQQAYTYTIEVPGSDKPGESCAFVHPSAKAYLSSSIPSGARTLYDSFKHSSKVHGHHAFLGTRLANADGTLGNYSWVNYDDVNRRAEKLGWGLTRLGLNEKDEDGLTPLYYGKYLTVK